MAGGELSIVRAERGDTVVLALGGTLDRVGADKLLADAAGVPQGGELVLDLSALSVLDPNGIRALANLDVRSRVERWTLAVAAAQPQVAELLAETRLDQRVDIRDAAP